MLSKFEELNRLPFFSKVLHTSSAVDIRTVIGQIETFWRQLRWPDAETAYVFISRFNFEFFWQCFLSRNQSKTMFFLLQL